MKFCLFVSFVVIISCSSIKGLRKKEFVYSDRAGDQKIHLLVPKGYRKELIRDTLGNKLQLYTYRNGAALYFIYGDTTVNFQYINLQYNIPKEHPAGGWMFKGIDSTGLFWREVRQGMFRVGYKNIPGASEFKFDTVVNYAVWQNRQESGKRK